jgi:hypothetical protein
MQAQAAEFRLRRKIPLLFGEKSFETVCFDSFILKQALKQARSVCLRAIWSFLDAFFFRMGDNDLSCGADEQITGFQAKKWDGHAALAGLIDRRIGF